MKWAKQSETDALGRLQQMAKDKNLELREIAQAIITADEAIGSDYPFSIDGSSSTEPLS